MKIDQFVAESLKQIISVVSEAQQFGTQHNANINPSGAVIHSSAPGQTYCSDTGIPIQNVEFDIAVTVSESTTNSEGGSSVGSISVSPNHIESNQNNSVSRIKFTVPLLLPTNG